MLHVNGGKDVDTRFQQLLDILPALWMTRAWRVAVRQFVHQDQRRTAGEGGIEIKFRHQTTAMAGPPGGQRG